MADEVLVDISEQRVEECLGSARFWAGRLGFWGARMQGVHDGFTTAAGLLSILTGLTIWSLLAGSKEIWAMIVVSAATFLAGALALLPKNIGWAEAARKAADLNSRYGDVLGDLIDALQAIKKKHPKAQAAARQAVAEFEKVKSEKDALHPAPTKLQKERDREKPRRY